MCSDRLIFGIRRVVRCALALTLAMTLAGCGLKTSPDKPNSDFPRTYPVR